MIRRGGGRHRASNLCGAYLTFALVVLLAAGASAEPFVINHQLSGCIGLDVKADRPEDLADLLRTLPQPYTVEIVYTDGAPAGLTCDTLRIEVGGEVILRLQTPRVGKP